MYGNIDKAKIPRQPVIIKSTAADNGHLELTFRVRTARPFRMCITLLRTLRSSSRQIRGSKEIPLKGPEDGVQPAVDIPSATVCVLYGARPEVTLTVRVRDPEEVVRLGFERLSRSGLQRLEDLLTPMPQGMRNLLLSPSSAEGAALLSAATSQAAPATAKKRPDTGKGDIKKDAWSAAEDEILRAEHDATPAGASVQWAEIAKRLPGRTGKQVAPLSAPPPGPGPACSCPCAPHAAPRASPCLARPARAVSSAADAAASCGRRRCMSAGTTRSTPT